MSNLTRQQFFNLIAPVITFVRQQGSPIFSSVRMAQSLLETGGSIPAWNNLGGIKVGNGRLTPYWRGSAINKGTWEVIDGQEVKETAAFRAYRTLYHYFKDQDELFKTARYTKVRTAQTAWEQAQQLQNAGYATDPAYANKLYSLIKQYQLEQYDQMATPLMKPAIFANADIVPIYHDELFIGLSFLHEWINFVPVRKVAEHFGAKVEWINKKVLINGVEINSMLAGSVSYIAARELASLLKLKIEWDANARVLFLN